MKSTKPNQSLWYWSPLSYLGFLLVAPIFVVRLFTTQKYRAGLRQRLTFYNNDERKKIQDGNFIWIHTVSVGELQAARPLLRELKKRFPAYRTFVTTVTRTGQNLAVTLDEVDESLYLPIDLYPLCARLIALVRPKTLLILETELWPNLIRAMADASVPMYLINARLSDTSFQHYLWLRRLFSPLLGKLTMIMAQSEKDRERFLQLGTPPERVCSPGNLKFEAAPQADDASKRTVWRERFQIHDEDILLLGGSTFPGEERLLAEVSRTLREEGIPIRVVIAPRHVERADAIREELTKAGFSLLRRSCLEREAVSISPHDVLLLDTIGELRSVYAASDLVFIGKSICDKGGQNPIEPAAWGKPILFGENMQNFKDIASLFLHHDGAIVVKNQDEFLVECRALCLSAEKREMIGRNAREVVDANLGALARIMALLRIPE
jgi:3-deoxy-D-manno-octulosonic-acid transferase